MKPPSSPARLAGFSLTGDGALGALGGGLALCALSFGVYMNVHGPSSSLGTSKDFTVFAQLAPHGRPEARPPRTEDAEELDTTATATIRGRAHQADEAEASLAAPIVVEAADHDSATLAVGGRLRVVRVGDELAGKGEIAAIVPGTHPTVSTTRGFTFSAREK